MRKKFATIILNRNLKKETEELYKKLNKYSKLTDIFILESGSAKKNLSKNYTWHANWKEANKKGLRFFRGMNFALSNLYKENKLNDYNYFLLTSNDAIFQNKNFYKKIDKIFSTHTKIGILCGTNKSWINKNFFSKKLSYVWYIQNNAIFLRKEFILNIMNLNKPGYKNFLFDGTNFRGYGLDTELVAKGYANYWATAISNEVIIEENNDYLLNQNDFIKTETFDKNLKLYKSEGLKWMKNKYGFTSKWSLVNYSKSFYEIFFKSFPKITKYRV